MKSPALFVAFVALLVAVPPINVKEEVTGFELWQLCSKEEKIGLNFVQLPVAALDIGITKTRIQNIAESRMRASRVFGGLSKSRDALRPGGLEKGTSPNDPISFNLGRLICAR